MILCDTGPLVAAAIKSQPTHHVAVELFSGLRLARRSLLVPSTVLAEVGYFLDRFGNALAEASFLESVAAGDFVLTELDSDDVSRGAVLTRQYADMRLGTTDASVIALSERLGVIEIATFDRRHFTAVRPRHVAALDLLPERL